MRLQTCLLLSALLPTWAAADGYRPEVRVTPLLRTTTTTAGQPLKYLDTQKPELTAVMVEIAPGTETGWHRHPVPCYAYILSGEISVEVEGRGSQVFMAGQAFAESVDLAHNGRNLGKEPVKILMFAAGTEAQSYSVRLPAPP